MTAAADETMCCPDREALCERCIANALSRLRSLATCRGEAWADELARSISRSDQWPSGSEAVIAIARVKVRDLARDPKLLELLAAELALAAEARWTV